MKPHKEVIYAGVVILVLMIVVALIVGCCKPKTSVVQPMDNCGSGQTCTLYCPPPNVCTAVIDSNHPPVVTIDPGPGNAPTHNMIPTWAMLPLTDQQKIDLLRQEAHRRGLKWEVIQSFMNPGKFLGEAHSETRRWYSSYEDTQADAAYSLYKKIQGEPTEKIYPKVPDLSGQ
jgi:hypothetical protein